MPKHPFRVLSNMDPVIRIFFFFCLAVLCLAIVQIVRVRKNTNSELRGLKTHVVQNSRALLDSAAEVAKSNLDIATFIATQERVRKAISNRDRQTLFEIIEPLIRSINKTNTIKIRVHFHLPPGISFLRVWKPDRYGDDISAFRKTVVDVLSTGRAVKGIEAGRIGLAVRGVAPIFGSDPNKPMASVEVITDLADVADKVQEDHKNTIQLFGLQRIQATASIKNFEKIDNFIVVSKAPTLFSSKVDAQFLYDALKRGVQIKKVGTLLLLGVGLRDYRGEPTGVYVEYVELSPLYEKAKRDTFKYAGLAAGAFVLAILLYFAGM